MASWAFSIVLAGLAGQPGFGEELDRPEYSRLPDSRVLFSGGGKKQVRRHMAFELKKGFEHDFSRFRDFPAILSEILFHDD